METPNTSSSSSSSPQPCRGPSWLSVLASRGHQAVVASHLLQDLRQAAQVAVGEVLGLPQVQDHAGGAGLGGKVVEVPEMGGEGRQRVRFLGLGLNSGRSSEAFHLPLFSLFVILTHTQRQVWR